MRPKKLIVLIDADEDRAGVACMVLTTSAFRVLRAVDWKVAINVIRSVGGPQSVHLLLIVEDSPKDANEIAKRLRRGRIPSMIVTNTSTLLPQADALLTFASSWTERIERIRLMTSRKRGPQPQEQKTAAI